jgi:hypothetical protein
MTIENWCKIPKSYLAHNRTWKSQLADNAASQNPLFLKDAVWDLITEGMLKKLFKKSNRRSIDSWSGPKLDISILKSTKIPIKVPNCHHKMTPITKWKLLISSLTWTHISTARTPNSLSMNTLKGRFWTTVMLRISARSKTNTNLRLAITSIQKKWKISSKKLILKILEPY